MLVAILAECYFTYIVLLPLLSFFLVKIINFFRNYEKLSTTILYSFSLECCKAREGVNWLQEVQFQKKKKYSPLTMCICMYL